MRKRFSILYPASYALSLCLMASSSQAAPTTIFSETATTISAAIGGISPLYKYKSTDAITVTGIAGNIATELDGATAGTAAVTASSSSYYYFDTTANTIKALACLNSTWKTFTMSSVPTSWNATTTLALPETVRDGASGPGSPWATNIILTKGAGAVDLTNTALSAFLAGCSTNSYTANLAGTALVSTTALTTGWTAKAYVTDGASAAQAAVMDPINVTINNTITTAAGAALAYTTALTRLDTWNVATNSTAVKSVNFTAPGGRSIALAVKPAGFARTAGVTTGLLGALNSMPPVFTQSAQGYQATLTSAVADVIGLLDSTPPDTIKKGLTAIAALAVGGAGYVIGDFTTTADTNKIGLVALAAGDITTCTWSVEGESLVLTGKIGTGVPKKFVCDMSGKTTFSSATNPVLTLTSADGDAVFIKCVDSTGYTSTTNTSIPASAQDTELALMITNLLSAVTTVHAEDLKTMVTSGV